MTARKPHVFLLGCGGCDLCAMRVTRAMPFALAGLLVAAVLARVLL